MANIFLKPTARFNPFSYQEMLAPIKSYTDAYNKMDEEFTNLDIMAGDVEGKLSNSEKDVGLKATYNKFNTDLQSAMESLYTKGLNSETKKQLNNLKARFVKELNPINEAYKAYQEDQKYLNKMAIEHPEIIIESTGSSISDYMNGNTPQVRSLNTDDLMTEALNIAKTKAGRTYKESNWTSTAGGRFLERTTEVGLNDRDFNNALAYAQNPKITAEDLGLSEEEFKAVKHNASLLSSSINDVLDTPSYRNLSDSNKLKAYNATIKGIRAGFGYKKDIKTHEDPMFAHNLALTRDALKAQQKAEIVRKKAIENIGSSVYRAVDLGKQSVDRFLVKDNTGKLTFDSKYANFFNSQESNGKLLSEEQLKNYNIGNFDRTAGYASDTNGSFYYQGYTPQYNMSKYKDLVSAIESLGLDPKTATRGEIIKRMNDAANAPDAFGRKRASIVSSDTEIIQKYIEKGLGNNKLEEVEGFKRDEEGVFRYKTKENISLDTLVDKNGNLNIMSIDMDYSTGERTFTVKDQDGNLREFKMPKDTGFEAEDQLLLDTNSNYLRRLESEIAAGNIIDDGITRYKNFGYLTASEYREMLQNELDFIFAQLLNNMGIKNINK